MKSNKSIQIILRVAAKGKQYYCNMAVGASSNLNPYIITADSESWLCL
jgi:hypothetical protein